MTTETTQVTAADTRTEHLTLGALELPAARRLFRSRPASILWLIVRLWLGWQWFSAGWQKLTGAGYGNWFTHSTGLQGFIAGANSSYDNRAKAFGHAEVTYGWYLHILNAIDAHAQVFSRVVTVSELAVGIGLLLGCLTGVAAAGGVALNIMYITGGSAGPNGIFILLGVLLVAAWRVAGYLGADYFLLPRPGVHLKLRVQALSSTGRRGPGRNGPGAPGAGVPRRTDGTAGRR
jgi:thiosulfate dehydrogenase [quinone] large subunit